MSWKICLLSLQVQLMASRSQGRTVVSRPKTSKTNRSLYHQQYRIADNQSLNTIHSQIKQVFKEETINRPYEEVKGLTSKYAAGYTKRIEKMCIKFGIRSNSTQLSTIQAQKINVQGIVKHFIRARSNDKLKQSQKTKMKQAIYLITERNQEITQTRQDFFKINRESLKKLEIKAYKKRINIGKKDHPYITIYQNSQKEALTTLIQKNRLSLQQINDHPSLIQVQDWQRQNRQIRKIYTGVKTFRSNNLKSASKNGSRLIQGNISAIFIT